MSFENYWADVCKLGALSQMAIQQLPNSLSESTKIKLMKLRPEETVRVLRIAIAEVDCGSVETIDSLTQKILQEKR